MNTHTDDAARFQELFDQNYRRVMAYCLRRMVDRADAEDVVAETFTVAWRRRGDLPADDADARAYLFGIARKLLLNAGRGRLRRQRVAAALRAQPRPVTEFPLADERVAAALESLSEVDREVLCLVAWDRLPHREVASILGVSEGAVAHRLGRARGRLRTALEDAGGGRTTTLRRARSGVGRTGTG